MSETKAQFFARRLPEITSELMAERGEMFTIQAVKRFAEIQTNYEWACNRAIREEITVRTEEQVWVCHGEVTQGFRVTIGNHYTAITRAELIELRDAANAALGE
jgi:hypothetical protein